ncbi:unnamed protein product [Durusdinium trenchii]|uniref:Uncharacterized protein n=1 Tax=Durusdinium trenchii TaxID=1381693 RepID=A0ABP0HMS3_9DINO
MRQYASLEQLRQTGGTLLRPWQLPHRNDFGLRGTADCEVQRSLCQLILLNGMLTDANLPGVEKLCVTLVQSNWLTLPLHKISREDIGFEAALAPPESCFMANSSIAAFAAAYSIGKLESAAAVNLLRKINPETKESLTLLVRFELRHGDADLQAMLEHSVPPASLSKVSIFAAHLQRYQNKAWLLI